MRDHGTRLPIGHDQEDFGQVLLDQLRRTPWLVISLVIHLCILWVLSLIGTSSVLDQQRLPVHVSLEVVEAPPEEPPPETDTAKEVVAREDDRLDPRVDEMPADVEDDPADEPLSEAEPGADDEQDTPFDFQGIELGNTIGIWTGAAGAFKGRNGPGGPGGTPGGRPRSDIVPRGLAWLAAHQSPDGSWDADGYLANCDATHGPRCEGKGVSIYDVGVSGLSLLAFLGAGQDHRSGPFRDNVKRGLRWLKDQQDPEGCFGSRSDKHFTYNHAIATLAMAEAYGMSGSELWHASAQQGLDFVSACQNDYAAWRYGVQPGDNDASVSGWMVMALKSGRMAELEVNETRLQWAADFIDKVTDRNTGRTGYTQRGEPPVRAEGRLEQFPASESESLTAVGMLTRIFAGQDPERSEMLKAGAELLSKRLPVWQPQQGKVDMYYWYYGSLAMHQLGGPAWTAWNERMKDAIVGSQQATGCQKGSWDPVGAWGEDGGRVYSTALMTMCLEVYYRYPRVFGTR